MNKEKLIRYNSLSLSDSQPIYQKYFYAKFPDKDKKTSATYFYIEEGYIQNAIQYEMDVTQNIADVVNGRCKPSGFIKKEYKKKKITGENK